MYATVRHFISLITVTVNAHISFSIHQQALIHVRISETVELEKVKATLMVTEGHRL